jgi:hypothetical protein
VRVSANYWIGIEGVDARPTVRRGNLSPSGIYFETSGLVGPGGAMELLLPVGSMQYLHLESEDRKVVLQVLTRIIRVNDIDDLVHGRSLGLAVEFMPATQVGRQNIARLVRHVVELGIQQDETASDSIAGVHMGEVLDREPIDRTILPPLGVHKLTLETEWKANVGDPVEVKMSRPERVAGRAPLSSRLAGQVTNVNPIADSYRVEIRVTDVAHALSHVEPQTFADVISDDDQDFSLPDKDHFSGLLSRIQLPTLLGLLEMEQMTGVLRFTSEGESDKEEISLFIREGRLLDASSNQRGARTIRELLAGLMKWPEGVFQFVVEALDRDDKVGSSMTELILDLAAEADAAGRPLHFEDPE